MANKNKQPVGSFEVVEVTRVTSVKKIAREP